MAKHCGLDHKTIAGRRAEICPTSDIPKSIKRTGTDGRPINLANMDKCDTPRGVQGSL
jgi:hypothetical protein